jgi:hypothetical protein
MRSDSKCSSPSTPPLSNPPSGPTPTVFSPAFLARLDEEDGVITATEAEYAGPWTTARVPGRPEEVGVVRAPAALAVVLEVAGAGALAQVDRLLGRQLGR